MSPDGGIAADSWVAGAPVTGYLRLLPALALAAARFAARLAFLVCFLVHGVFIRAPWVEETGPGVEALARVGAGPAVGRIVAVRQGRTMATSFHPEVGSDVRIHRLFRDLVSNGSTTGS